MSEQVQEQEERAPNGRAKVAVPLVGEDGNVFFVIGRCRRAMRDAGWTMEEVNGFSDRAMACHSYDEVLAIVQDYCYDEGLGDLGHPADDDDDDDRESESEFDAVYNAAPEGTLVGLCLRCGRAFADGEEYCPDCDRPQSAPDAETEQRLCVLCRTNAVGPNTQICTACMGEAIAGDPGEANEPIAQPARCLDCGWSGKTATSDCPSCGAMALVAERAVWDALFVPDYCHCCHADLTRETHRESCENAGPSGHISD